MQLIYIAGNTGSGKSTFITAIAARRPWFAGADPSPPLNYMADLFADPVRWAMETQVAFLVSKAAAVLNIPNDAGNAMIDRSIYEHAEVFAKTFRDIGAIGDRAYQTYEELYALILKSLPVPRLVILCSCCPAECERRVRLRDRLGDRLVSSDFINTIDQRLHAWAREFIIAPIYSLDTETFDMRDPHIAEAVAMDVENLMQNSHADCEILNIL